MLAALGWGSADFSGAVASRRVAATTVVLGSQLISSAVALALALVRGEPFPGGADLLLASGAGLATAAALTAFYRGLATARVGVVAPVAAMLGAGVPVLVGISVVGPPAAMQLVGMAVGLLAVGLVSRAPGGGTDDRPHGFRIALLAGAGFGAFFVCMGLLETTAVFWPLVVARVVAVGAIAGLMLASGSPLAPPRSLLPLVALVGILDMAGMAGYLLATQVGRLDEAAVLSSMYPAVTIVLAAVVFRERIGGLQGIGILLSLAAIVLIGAG